MRILVSLAWRNLWRNKRRTLITVSSVVFAVILAIALVAMAVGLRNQLIETIVRNETGYLQVQDVMYYDEPSLDHVFEFGEEVKSALALFEDQIDFTVPRIRGFSLAAKDASTRGVIVTGIVPELEDRMNNLSSNMAEGSMFKDEDDSAVIAEGLATLLNISVGDNIALIGQGFYGMTAAGQYSVGGIIELSIPEQNNSMVYLPLKEAQRYFAAPERLTNLIIMTGHDVNHGELAEDLNENLDSEWFSVLTWDQLMPDMVGLLEMRETVNQIMAWVLYMVVGFGIFGTILTMMSERLKEFGILLSIGLKRSQLSLVCFMETIIISLMGVFLGIVAGYPIMFLLHRYPLEFTGEMAEYMVSFGMEPIIPFSIAPEIFINQAISIFIIAVLIGFYPVIKVFKMNIVSSVRD